MINRTTVPHFGIIAEFRNARRTNITSRRSTLTFTVDMVHNPHATWQMLSETVQNQDRVDKNSIQIKVGTGNRRFLTLDIEIPSSIRGRLDPWIDSKVNDILTAVSLMQVPSPMAKAEPELPVTDEPQQAKPAPAVRFEVPAPAPANPQNRGYNARSSKARRMTRKRARDRAISQGNMAEAKRISRMLRTSDNDSSTS